MRYIYCKGCGKPIRGMSTFEEAVIKGVPCKPLTPSCGSSGDFCQECYMNIKEELQNIVCNSDDCRLYEDGICTKLYCS